MKIKNRLTAVFLAAGLVMTNPGAVMLPAGTVQAAETASGTCGENVTWTLDDAGTLTISGTGEMTNWSTYSNVPWYAQRDSIKKAVIEDGVTSIGNYAFCVWSGMTSVTIPGSVTSIGDHAFHGCTGLTSVTIPDSVTSIGEMAFYGCTGLTSVTIPDSVTSIVGDAFRGCTGLTEITIPDSVTSIGSSAFYNCTGLTEITIPEGVTDIGLYAFRDCTALKDIIILNPDCKLYDRRDTIFSGAVIHGYEGSTAQAYAEKFSRTFETYIEPEESDLTVGRNDWKIIPAEDGIFVSGETTNPAVAYVSLSADGTKAAIHSLAHGAADIRLTDGTGAVKLIHVTVTSAMPAHSNAVIGQGTCGRDGDNLRWIIPSSAGTLKITGTGAMQDYDYEHPAPWSSYADRIHSIQIESGVTEIGQSAFYDCYAVGSAEIADTVQKIGWDAFMLCGGLTSVTIPESVREIGVGAFFQCSNLASVTLAEGVSAVGQEAFIHCEKLREINIPASLKTIGAYAFNGTAWMNDKTAQNPLVTVNGILIDGRSCKGSVDIPAGVTKITDCAFCGNAALTAVTIPESVTEIGYAAFDGCVGLSEVTLPASVEKVGIMAFSPYSSVGRSALKSVTILNPACEIVAAEPGSEGPTEAETFPEDAVIYGYAGSTAEDYAKTNNRTFETIKEIIASGTCGANLVWTLDSEGTLTISGSGDMSDFESANNIPWVNYRTDIKEIKLPDGLTAIGKLAFYECVNIGNVTIPDGVTRIGIGAFNQSSLNKVNIPDSVTSIENSAFVCCPITEISLPKGLKNLDEAALSLTKLTSVTLPDGLTTISDGLFQYSKQLKTVEIPESVTKIGAVAFSGTGLETVSLSGNVNEIAIHAFSGCECLTDIIIRNPECKISDDDKYTIPENTVIHGYAGSTAEDYAKKYSRTFIPLDTPATTTTATTTTTTATTTATTTTATTTAENTVTTTTTVTPFRYGNFNEWGFVNDRRHLAVKKDGTFQYYLKDSDRKKLFDMLTDTERAKIDDMLADTVYGYCYGMSVTAVLAYYNVFRPSDLVSGTRYLADIDFDNMNEDVQSAVNYYQLLQYTNVIAQLKSSTYYAADSIKLRQLIDALEAGKPVVLGYVYEGQNSEPIGHAVIAYEMNRIEGSIPLGANEKPFRYDVRVRIYDNQQLTYGESSAEDLFINTTDWTWCIPKTDNSSEYSKLAVMNLSSHHNGVISLVLTEPDIMNCCGLFNGTKRPENIEFDTASVRYTALNGIESYGAVTRAPDGTALNAAAGVGNIRFSSDLTENAVSDERLAYIDSDVGFYLAPEKAEAMSISMEYENYLMRAKADMAQKIQFTPDAEIECINTSGNYALEMVVNKEVRGIDWHKITVTGKDGGNLKMRFEPDGKGFILSGDSLKNVTVRANTYDTEAEGTFSSNYASVRIYEIDVNTIGIQADKDGNGVYETELPARQKGDADGDGEITNKDAQYVLVAYTESLGTGKVDLPEADALAADVDGDGKVGVADAQYILIYYTANTIAGSATKWEDIISA